MTHSTVAPLVQSLRFEAPPCAFGPTPASAPDAAGRGDPDGNRSSNDDDDDSDSASDTRAHHLRRHATASSAPPQPLSHHLSRLPNLRTLSLTMTHPTSSRHRGPGCPSSSPPPAAPLTALLTTLIRTVRAARLPRLEAALLTLPYEGGYDAGFFGAPCLAAAALLDERSELGDERSELSDERSERAERAERAERHGRTEPIEGDVSISDRSGGPGSGVGVAASAPSPSPALAHVAVKLADRSGNFTVMRVR